MFLQLIPAEIESMNLSKIKLLRRFINITFSENPF